MTTPEEDAQTAALQEYFEDNTPASYGASFRAGWDARRIYEVEEIGQLQQLLLKAASNGHVLMKHPPYGSSFLDCDLGPCTGYRAALPDRPRPRSAEEGHDA